MPIYRLAKNIYNTIISHLYNFSPVGSAIHEPGNVLSYEVLLLVCTRDHRTNIAWLLMKTSKKYEN